jgi:pyruvate,water dikinase
MRVLVTPDEIRTAASGGKAKQLAALSEIACVPRFVALIGEDDEDVSLPTVSTVLQHFEHGVREELFAVRSSANVEDSSELSFAGLFTSILGVDRADLPGAIDTVVRSVHADRVRVYCQSRGCNVEDIHMSVIVQVMVPADRSGVCFSRANEHPNYSRVEAVLGLAEPLVSGMVSPDSYRVDRTTREVIVDQLGYQKRGLYLSENGVLQRQIPAFDRHATKLLDREAVEVSLLALAIERSQRYAAVDIEWAYVDERLYLLQARPFTGFDRLEHLVTPYDAHRTDNAT